MRIEEELDKMPMRSALRPLADQIPHYTARARGHQVDWTHTPVAIDDHHHHHQYLLHKVKAGEGGMQHLVGDRIEIYRLPALPVRDWRGSHWLLLLRCDAAAGTTTTTRRGAARARRQQLAIAIAIRPVHPSPVSLLACST
jgi:hypothetical protein